MNLWGKVTSGYFEKSRTMPVINLFDINESRVGIWHITEPANQLLSQLEPGKGELDLYREFSNDRRKRQWLGYHLLLKYMLSPLAADLIYDIYGKPFLKSGSHHISVSHAGDYAAAICNRHFSVGVDIEKISERIQRVKDRFLNNAELEQLGTCAGSGILHVYWCGKEALYKLNGEPDVDFKNDIHINAFDYLCDTNGTCSAKLTKASGSKKFTLHYRKLDDYMLVVAG